MRKKKTRKAGHTSSSGGTYVRVSKTKSDIEQDRLNICKKLPIFKKEWYSLP